MPPSPGPRKPDLAAFRFDAGRLSLDFVGTVGHRPAEHVERLSSADRLVAWVVAAGLPAPTEQPDGAGLARAIALREDLLAVLDAALDTALDGVEPASSAVAAVNAAAAHPTPTPRLGAGLGVTYAPPVGLDALLSVLARDALELLADDDLRAKLRRCAAGDCRKIFLDTAPRPRRWCSRQYCGTRSRVAAHRARATASAATGCYSTS